MDQLPLPGMEWKYTKGQKFCARLPLSGYTPRSYRHCTLPSRRYAGHVPPADRHWSRSRWSIRVAGIGSMSLEKGGDTDDESSHSMALSNNNPTTNVLEGKGGDLLVSPTSSRPCATMPSTSSTLVNSNLTDLPTRPSSRNPNRASHKMPTNRPSMAVTAGPVRWETQPYG